MSRSRGGPSGYYDWLLQPVSNRAQEDTRLLRLIRASFTASHGIYGAPRVFLDLREAGETCSKHRVARLMRQANLRALHGYRTRRWAVGKPSVLIPNLLQRRFTATKPNAIWVTDIARVALPGRCHGFVLTPDRGVGRPAHHSSRARAQCRAHGRAATTATRYADSLRPGHPVRQRRVAPILPFESSRTEYEPEGQLLGRRRRGGLFSSVKKERIKKQIYKNRELAIAELADYIDSFYNRTRRHSHLGGVSPEQFELAH